MINTRLIAKHTNKEAEIKVSAALTNRPMLTPIIEIMIMNVRTE